MPSPEPADPVIVTSTSRLRALVNEAAERAAERAVRQILAELRSERSAVWLTVPQSERAFGVKRSTLHRWALQGTVQKKKVGGRIYYRAPDAD